MKLIKNKLVCEFCGNTQLHKQGQTLANLFCSRCMRTSASESVNFDISSRSSTRKEDTSSFDFDSSSSDSFSSSSSDWSGGGGDSSGGGASSDW